MSIVFVSSSDIIPSSSSSFERDGGPAIWDYIYSVIISLKVVMVCIHFFILFFYFILLLLLLLLLF